MSDPKKLTAWAEFKRCAIKWYVPFGLAFLALFVLYAPILYFLGKIMESF